MNTQKRIMQIIVSELSDDQIEILLNCCEEELLYRGYEAAERESSCQEALEAREQDRLEPDWDDEFPF